MLLLIPLKLNHLVSMLNSNENMVIFRTVCHKHNIQYLHCLKAIRIVLKLLSSTMIIASLKDSEWTTIQFAVKTKNAAASYDNSSRQPS